MTITKLADLGHFTGTAQYWRYSPLFPSVLLTDGAKYVAEEGEAFWLMDAIASVQSIPMIRNDEALQSIQFWRLAVHPDRSAPLTCERDEDDIVYTQEIQFTDFPLDRFLLYVCPSERGKVIMLPSEY